MSVYLFTALFLFLLCSTSFFALTSTAGTPQPDSTTVQSVEIFKNDKCLETLKSSGSDGAAIKEIKNFDNVFFVTTDKMLVAVAEAKYTKTGNGGKDKYDFVSAYPKTDNWDDEIFKQGGGDDICKKWKAQLVKTNIEDAKGFFTAKNVVYDKKKNIYLLAMNNTSDNDKWEYYIFVGGFSEGSSPPLAWTTTTSANKKELKFSDNSKFKDKLEVTKKLIGSPSTYGGAFVTNKGNVVFILRATDEQNKYSIVFVGFKGDPNENQQSLEVLHVEDTAKDCYPYLFLWDEKIVMITTNCTDKAKQNVKESSDLTQWENSSGPFHYLSDFFKDKTSFTTAVISDRNVLLFAKQKKEQCSTGAEEQGQKKCFTFWFSDGNRTYNIGETILETEKDVVSSSIIFANKKLFFLVHQKSEDKKFILTRLDKQLKTITKTLGKWRSADGIVSNLCLPENPNSKTICAAPLPTEGLVGFLSGKDSTGEWKDEYLFVNAEIIRSAEINNGLICNGAGQGAKWPVDQGNEKKAYNFKDPGFTLVAPVKISGNANQTNSILGVGLKGTGGSGNSHRSIGLWCSDKGKWAVGKGETQSTELVPTSENCEQGETYSVVLVFNKNQKKVEVHIDGTKLEISTADTMNIDTREAISHFYFGADEDQNTVETQITIKYVLLYSRPLNQHEIDGFKIPKIKKVANPEHTEDGNKTPGQQGDNNTKNNEDVNNEESGKTEDKQSSSPPPTTEDGAVRVGVVGVLCFMFFGVFTLLGRYVY